MGQGLHPLYGLHLPLPDGGDRVREAQPGPAAVRLPEIGRGMRARGKRTGVRRSEFVYRDGERKGRGESAGRTEKRICVSGWRTKEARGKRGSYGESNLCIGMANERDEGVRKSESTYRDSEHKSAREISLRRAFVRRSESTYRDGERKSAGVYG